MKKVRQAVNPMCHFMRLQQPQAINGAKTGDRTIPTLSSATLRIEDRKGSIALGKDADLVLLDRNYSVYTTIVAGKVVFPELNNLD